MKATDWKVDDNFAYTPPTRGAHKYPWEQLEVGQSFTPVTGAHANARCATKRYAPKVFKAKVSTRKRQPATARIWRLK